MMTSLLLVDVQGFEALAKGQANPTALTSELSHTMHGLTRQIAVMRAYCSNRVSSYRRTAYREAGFEIIETSGPDETLIRISVDLHKFATSAATYEEAILLGGTTDYTALARLAREHLMMVSVVDHATISSALEAIADGLIDLDDLEIDRSSSIAPAPSFKPRERTSSEPPAPRAPFSTRPAKQDEKPDEKSDKKSAQDAPKLDHPEDHKPSNDASDGDAWPDPKTGPILVAGAAAGAGAAALMATDAGANGASVDEPAPSGDASEQADAKDADAGPETKVDASPKAETAATEPAIEAELEDAIAASLSDDLTNSLDEDLAKGLAQDTSADFGDDLDAELEAELTAELVPDLAANDASSTDDSSTGKEKTATANGAAEPASDVSVEDDSTIDALFADIAGGDDKLGPADVDTTSVDPAVTAAPIDIPMMADVKADADVDQLLSRLMSDDLAGEGAEPKKAELDVVPER
ncbi:MAG: NYN domain-containing protein [Pseudomonadota bacterium]